MTALQLLKDKLGALEQDAPFIEQKMQNLIAQQNKKTGEISVPLDHVLSLEKKELSKLKDVIDLQLRIISHGELIQETNEQIRDYQQAVDQLEVK